MARAASTDYARDGEGNAVLRTYEIPYRPQYVRTFGRAREFGPNTPGLPTGPWNGDQRAFRFHVSDEAMGLLVAQGARNDGFQRIEVVWDATSSGFVMLKATQGVTVEQMEKETTTV